jgi:hypothetical protein
VSIVTWPQRSVTRIWAELEKFWDDVWGKATRHERKGYLFWLLVVGVILLLEVFSAYASSKWAFAWMGDPRFLTISSTVSHLEDQWSGVAILVLGILTASAFYSIAVRSTVKADPAPEHETAPAQPAEPELARFSYSPWMVLTLWLATFLVLLLIFGPLKDILSSPLTGDVYRSDKQYRTGYAIYGAIAFWGIVVPLAVHKFRPTWIGYPNLFATVRSLGDKRPILAVIVLAGLIVLAVHLILYPWPSLSRESTDYAGLSREDARNEAQEFLGGQLFPTSEARGHIRADYDGNGIDDDVRAWLIFMGDADFPETAGSNCVVAVWANKSGEIVTTASTAC